VGKADRVVVCPLDTTAISPPIQAVYWVLVFTLSSLGYTEIRDLDITYYLERSDASSLSWVTCDDSWPGRPEYMVSVARAGPWAVGTGSFHDSNLHVDQKIPW
jgi:hypothetical protein